MEKQHKEYFDSHPSSLEVFQTADGNLFHHDYQAKAHARNLDNKVVVRIARANAPEATETTVATATVTVPNKGVDAIAPVVADPDGTVVSPGVGETSTSPVAATQILDKTGAVIDPGTVDPNAPVETVVEVRSEMTTDVPVEAAAETVVKAPEKEAEKATVTEPVQEEKAANKRAAAKPAAKK